MGVIPSTGRWAGGGLQVGDQVNVCPFTPGPGVLYIYSGVVDTFVPQSPT